MDNITKHEPAGQFNYFEEIKKSKFIVNISKVENEADALKFIKNISNSSANHNCWAFKIGDTYRFSDDGEPGGTAGKPILKSIDYSNIENICVVVTRFFGGIKLGAGGLIRVYAGVTKNALNILPIRKIENFIFIKMEFEVKYLSSIYNHIKKHNFEIINESFLENSLVIQKIRIISGKKEYTEKYLTNLTNGNIKIKELLS